jgi:SAM-dependent methyltransferase
MKTQDLFVRVARRSLRLLGLSHLIPEPSADPFAKHVDAQLMKANADSEMAKLFYGHQGRLVWKWDHYLAIYERHLRRFRENRVQPVRLLEIGVFHGGSLQLWRKYFGPTATIFGVDIDPRCCAVDSPDLCVRIGSQADPEFLKLVVGEMGGVDVVLDDGSHVASHQRRSFETLFPLLDPNGVYIVEDLHASYWRGFEGGFRRRGTFIEETKALVDDIHGWYHTAKSRFPDAHKTVDSIHIYDSVVVIEKKPRGKPFHTVVGTPSF